MYTILIKDVQLFPNGLIIRYCNIYFFCKINLNILVYDSCVTAPNKTRFSHRTTRE